MIRLVDAALTPQHLSRSTARAAPLVVLVRKADAGRAEVTMKKITLILPMFGFIVATRAMLAFGVGLLVSGKIPPQRRRTIGLACVAIGAATTVPAVASVVGHLKE